MSDLSATERCVKCGLCLPHCPTFALTGNEADSPRGRIRLMQLLDQTEIPLSSGLFTHLDQCLQCHACESMCPSKVPFSDLMDTARARLEAIRKRSFGQRLARRVGLAFAASRGLRRIGSRVIHAAQRLQLDKAALRLPLSTTARHSLLALAPAGDPRSRPAPGNQSPAGRIQLFTGCTGDALDRTTLAASRRLLSRLGYAVDEPSGQGCCGALHQHNGELQTAAHLADINVAAFRGEDPVLCFASGCAARLQDYARYSNAAARLAQRSVDILGFLAERGKPAAGFAPLRARVALHLPCTHRNVLQQTQAITEVLGWIPELDVITVNPDGGCCGAAGSYMLSQPDMSARLADGVADRIRDSRAGLLLTTNIGCALQLRATLAARQQPLEVLHPVTLLERQLAD
jgi:glycolate oxidase iron-sulfur subunit